MSSFERFSEIKILVIGDLMLDRYWWGRVERISPEAPVPIVRLERTTLSAGGAANVAANIGGLGARAILLGVTGDDPESIELEQILEQQPGVETSLLRLADRPTTVKTRIVAHDQQVVRLDSERSSPISAEQAEEVTKRCIKLLPDVNSIVISDYAKGLLTEALLTNLIAAARDAGKFVFVDPKGKDFSRYRGATMITPNLSEAANACALEPGDPNLVVYAGAAMLNNFDLEHALITEGAGGMTLFHKDGMSSHLDSIARNVYDVTGAGDTVIASFAVAASAGFSFLEAARISNYAAGIAVGQVGTAIPSVEQLRSVMDDDRDR